ncbi:MAG: SDR family NAD(P)-dependent oxidoreductase [Limimaricola soesokkakensis]|uniref:SDR family NAD(P)-dependent oxidoreductase n=1 Tax=Limimaricola soesokkakensis TaxID=1343159 RepID=UPI004059CCCD
MSGGTQMNHARTDLVPQSRGWTLITGASSGLGVEFARIAARGGRRLILSARSEDKLETLAAELRERVEVVVIPADLARPGAAERLWREASEGRRIEILVNNAGLGLQRRFGDGGTEEVENLVAVNVSAATVLMQAAVAHMRKEGAGHIMNVASVAAFIPGPGMAVYHATKAYLLSLSDAVSSELSGEDIDVTVTALCPGPVDTGFFEAAGMAAGGPSGPMRPARARDVAQAGWEAMLAGRQTVVPGGMTRIAAFAGRVLPRGLTARIAGRAYGRS